MSINNDYILEVQYLSKQFPIQGGFFGNKISEVRAVNNVSLKIKKGETLGLVGESGCGKTTLGRMITRLIAPSEGKIIFDGRDITAITQKEMQSLRKQMQIIFQDPYASLNPRMKVRTILREPLKIHKLWNTVEEETQCILQLLEYVQLPKTVLMKYPHEFSGGQRQRICIARALAVKPRFIVFDEAVSALDVSVQAQIINLLMDLQEKLGLTYLFISHDLKVVEFIAHQIAVMYLGNIVESGFTDEVYKNPQHPYTKALLSAIPNLNPNKTKEQIILQGEVPSPITPPLGCHFHPRCWRATNQCRKNYPARTYTTGGHMYRCYHPLKEDPKLYSD